MHRRITAVSLASGLIFAGALAASASAPAYAATETVTLVGSLQNELGCAADWDPACAQTELAQVADSTVYASTFTLPAGTYEYKVAIDGSWDVNYGADGALNGSNLPISVGGETKLTVSYDDTTHLISVTPNEVAGGTTKADRKLARNSLRAPSTKERFYFVMADRFANGSTANDAGGLTGTRLTTGFDPTDKAFYHGGDLTGLTSKLNYIKGLGTTAIWLTPSFKNKAVQGAEGQESAGYHGYWITDFTQIDPHLGTNDDMKALIKAAHKKGMKVYFDIITNHTADVIDYKEGSYTYRSKKNFPYKTATGDTFNDRDYLNQTFPKLSTDTSFPYTPYVHEGEEDVKVPAWLNDPLLYHNRGDSTYSGESSTYGDFVGLDDLFTERPEVVSGMGDIYKTWVDFGIDGFRIDTVKHVNLEFWQQFIPDILAEADKIGNDDFFAFGEVYDGNPAVMSEYTTSGKLQATLDFGFQQQVDDYAKGKPANVLADFFAKDDYYTDADSNAYQLPTFLGNHDMGRVAMFLEEASSSDEELMQRVKFANALMFTTRGNPVTYYGDEQGFVSTGGDQLAREDMFASQVDIYNNEKVLGGKTGSMDRYDTSAPLYRWISKLSALRAKYPALANGAQVPRYAADGAGVFAISRYDKRAEREFIVVANNSTDEASATFDTWTSKGKFVPVFGATRSVRADKAGSVKVTVPALSVAVYRATSDITKPKAAPTVSLTTPTLGGEVSGRAEIGAAVTSDGPAQVSFYYRELGTSAWKLIGTDDHAPYRVFHDVSGMDLGTMLEYRAVASDTRKKYAAASSWAVVGKGESSTPTTPNGDPVEQPSAVSVPGTHNSEMGCAADWLPDCDQAQLGLDSNDKIWKKSYSITPGAYGYKAALDRAWTVNYGAKATQEGENISYETVNGYVSFYFDPATHWITSDAEGPIVTAPGAFQSELGCSKDWDPACMRPWLQDPDGDGVYTWSTKLIPAGTYGFKIAEGLDWDVNYGDGGAAGGDNITVTVPADGATTTFSYDSSTHQTTVASTP